MPFSPLSKSILIIAIGLSALLFIAIRNNVKLREQKVVLQSNYEILQTKSSEAQILTKKEFEKFYSKLDSLADVLDIKTKHIKQIITTEYRFHDSTIIKTKTVIDTVKGRINFEAIDPKGCYSVSGYVSADSSVYINGLEMKDSLSIFVFRKYKKWHHKLVFWKDKSVTDVKIFSACKNDTIKITNNIIIKK